MSEHRSERVSQSAKPLSYLKAIGQKKLLFTLAWLAGGGLVLLGATIFSQPRMAASESWLVDRVLGIGPLVPSLSLIGILLFWVVWWLPRWQVNRSAALSEEKRFDRENEARKTFAQIIGGTLVLAGLYSSVQTLNLSREGHITDRFTKAIEQLGALDVKGRPKIEVRLGGIYALERIARDSERDHRVIMEILTTYIREYSPRKIGPEEQSVVLNGGVQATAQLGRSRIPADIQAILNVIGRREVRFDEIRYEEDGLNLDSTDLHNAMFAGDFHHVHFKLSDLRGADFSGVNLADANLFFADLRNANLRGATLGGYKMLDTDLDGTDMRGTRIRGADLRYVKNLTQGQLSTANGDSTTLIPFSLKRPVDWPN